MRKPRLTDKRMEGMRALASAMELELECTYLQQFTDDYAKELEEIMMSGINYIHQLSAWKSRKRKEN